MQDSKMTEREITVIYETGRNLHQKDKLSIIYQININVNYTKKKLCQWTPYDTFGSDTSSLPGAT